MELQPSIGQISGAIELSPAGSLLMILLVLALYFGFIGVLFYFSLRIAGVIKLAFAWIQSRNPHLNGSTELAEPPPSTS
jgi:hypothetical protein